jgi:CheY-like chemotaxis protein
LKENEGLRRSYLAVQVSIKGGETVGQTGQAGEATTLSERGVAVFVNGSGQPQANRRETILLVEDDVSVRIVASQILHESGYDVLEAASGEEAINLIRDGFADRIDLLLTDIEMPGMGGRELAGQLKSICPGLSTLFTSGYPEVSFVNGGRIAAPGAMFLQKPFSLTSLVRKTREALDRSCNPSV